MKNTPEIRFKGFTDAWAQRKLGEISQKVTEKNKNIRYKETLTNSAEHGIISQSDFFDKDISNQNNLNGYFIVGIDDFVYNPRISNLAPVGPIKRNLLGRTGVMSPLYYIFRFVKGDFTFFEKYFESDYWHKFMKLNGDSGARVDRFNIKDGTLEEMPLPFPIIEEQIAIGNFFRTLDSAIALLKRKLDNLKLLKKAYLQQMFPQEGETVPKIRFAGFTGDWDVRKLGEITSFSKGNGYSKSDLISEGTPIILYGRLYTKYETVIENVDTFADLKEKSIISKGGEVIVPSSGETAEDISRASVVSKSGIILGGDLNILEPCAKINSIFLALSISNGNQQKELTKRAQGKSIVHINNSDLSEVCLQFPVLFEQIAICNYFLNLEKQIFTQEQKLDQIKKLKSAYLQKMFV